MMLECDKLTQIFRLPLDKIFTFIGKVTGCLDDFLAVLVGIESNYQTHTEDQPGMFRQVIHEGFLYEVAIELLWGQKIRLSKMGYRPWVGLTTPCVSAVLTTPLIKGSNTIIPNTHLRWFGLQQPAMCLA